MTEFMKTVLIYSGGLDSTVLLAHMKSAGYEVNALSVNVIDVNWKKLLKFVRI